MKKSLPAISGPPCPPDNQKNESKTPEKNQSALSAPMRAQPGLANYTCPSGKLHFEFAGYFAFGAAVFVSVVAAVTVANHDVPLMLGGF